MAGERPEPLLGAHLSVAGGMVHALEAAEALGMTCVQVFTKNQRQWRVPPLAQADIDAWEARLRAMGWHRKRGPARVVCHNTYLINLASPDPELRAKSIALQRVELERCETLGIPLCVAHPGAHLGAHPRTGKPLDLEAPPTKDELAGLRRIATALDAIHADVPGYRTLTCLETTVGSGSNLGYAFHHLAFIRDAVREPDRVGFCLDTCHVTAAGYDMTTDERAVAVLDRFDAVCGVRNLRVIHANDSVGAVGSRRDRHADIGAGTCGRACFRTIMNPPRRLAALDRVPKILETPKGEDGEGVGDAGNLRALKRLIQGPRSGR